MPSDRAILMVKYEESIFMTKNVLWDLNMSLVHLKTVSPVTISIKFRLCDFILIINLNG